MSGPGAGLPASLEIRPLAGPGEAEACARLMAASEPWITLGRDVAGALRLIADPVRETHVALLDGRVAGFVILVMQGAFVGWGPLATFGKPRGAATQV